jgi:hypothetical protein
MKRVDHVALWRRAGILFFCLAAVLGTEPAHAEDEPRGVTGWVSLEEGFTDNVRADRLRRDDAWYTTFEASGEWNRPRGWLPNRVGGIMRARIYPDFDNRDYAAFGPILGYDWARVSLTVDYLYSPNHLRVDPAETIDSFADIHDLTAELRSKLGKKKRLTALVQLEFDADFYDAAFRERSFYEEAVEAGLRYRINTVVTPRMSFTYSTRDAISSNYDRQEFALRLGLDLYLASNVRTLVRYEKTWREFLAENENDAEGDRNSNFGREDDEHDVEVGVDAPVPWTTRTTVHLRYNYKDNQSTRTDRNYHVNEASLRIAYEF